MTDCNRQPLQFSTLVNKAVVADFLGGRLTTDAGALLLREVAERIGLFDALDAVIPTHGIRCSPFMTSVP